MSNTIKNLIRHPYGKDGRDVMLPVDGGSHIYEGTFVSQLNSTAMLVPGSTASSGAAVGVAVHEADNTSGSDGAKRLRVETDRIFEFANGLTTDACSEATPMFAVVYMGDDHTVFDNDGSGSLKPAGRFMGMSEDGKVRVYVGMANLAEALADAADVAIADAGLFTATSTVETALQELYQDRASVQKQVNIPITAALEVATGAMLAVFANGSTTVPGTQLTNSKAVSVRWNNDAAPAAIAVTVAMPQDLDDAANVVFHALVSKVGATLGDATKLTVGAFEQTVGALHDADTDFGGDTSAVVGDATSKTVSELTLTLALADIHATPSAITFTIKPKAGTLGTDDFCLHAAWLEYKGKLLTS
jgi:hypothetical protein